MTQTASRTCESTPTSPRRRDRGAILLLMFLVIMVLLVVIVQMRLSSMSDASVAQNQMRDFRFEFAAKGAFENARSLLITDLRDEELDAQAESGGGEGSEEGEGNGGGNFGGGGAGGPGAGGEEQEPPNDTMKDNWADPGQANQQMGDVDVRTRIVDEDRKFNLLSIVARDEDFRELSRERAIRLLDTFREGSEFDLSYGDATEIVDELAEWFTGERPSGFPTPPPQIVKQDPGARFDDSEQRFSDEEAEPIHYPLSFDELLMIDKLDESILYGVFDDGRFVPGLCDVATIYSNLVFDAEAHAAARGPIEEDEAGSNVAQPGSGGGSSGSSSGSNSGFQSPFGSGGDSGSGGESTKGDEEEVQGPPTDAAGQMLATETNQGRININTAPLAVLRILVPDEDIPYSVLEKIDEFRRTALDEELLEQARRRGYGSEGEGKGGEDESEDSGFGNDEEEDPEALKDDFTFHKADEVFEKVQDYFDTNFELPEEARLSFQSAIDVKSQVFTIYIELRDRKNASGGTPFDASGAAPPDAIYRAIVWRRKEGEGFLTVPILPLHPWTGSLPPETEDYRKEFPFGF